MNLVWIALGGALGTLARYGCSELAVKLFGTGFPWGTLFINVLGSGVIGLFAALPSSPGVKQFVMVGICGGYTTFSSFSLQTFTLLQNGETLKAFANVIGSVLLCLTATWAGFILGKMQ